MIDETGRTITPSRLEAIVELRNLHDEAWGQSISPFLPPFSYLTAEERWAVCERARGTPAGCFVEVGVFKGGSAYHLIDVAKVQGREVWLYDTFAGMAYEDPVDTIHVGEIKADEAECRKALGDYPHIVKCVFPDTLEMPPAPIAFAHIDCDQYRAIRESALYLIPRMAVAGIMLFDDAGLIHMPGATLAVEELFEGRIKKTHHNKYYVQF